MDIGRVQKEIGDTIASGAPLYNSGDHKGCERLYRGLAEELIHKTRGSGDSALERARGKLKDACASVDKGGRSASENAWTYRNAFDQITGMMGGGSRNTRDIEDVCRNPRNCQRPNCNCGKTQQRSSSSSNTCGPPQGCRNPRACQFPNCNCGSNSSCGSVPSGCQRPSCCAYPRCDCGRRSSCNSVPSGCLKPGACAYPNCGCTGQRRSSGSCGRNIPRGCERPAGCRFPNCNCRRMSR